jgi:hypothetical protein
MSLSSEHFDHHLTFSQWMGGRHLITVQEHRKISHYPLPGRRRCGAPETGAQRTQRPWKRQGACPEISWMVRKGTPARLMLVKQVCRICRMRHIRHSCLTNLVRKGHDLILVAEIGGHKRLETTRRYALPSLIDKQRALDSLL